jgi:hypothetical protein
LKLHTAFHSLTFVALGCALASGAQAQTTPAPAATPAPAPAPAPAPTWSVGTLDFSGYIDGYLSYNANRPGQDANGQTNDLYNFNDKTDQFNLSAAKLTINHTADPIGVHVDLILGRSNVLMHSSTDKDTDNYLEQAYVSATPGKTHGTEFDLGQFVTSAGAEVIEAKDDWSYSRSLLFAWAIPYYHFGLRTSTPVTKVWTAGFQLVNGWNNVVDNNLIDTTLTLTPTAKFSAYINYDYMQNKSTITTPGNKLMSDHLSGIAFAAHGSVSPNGSLTGRYEYFHDNEGYSTGTAQKLQEFTGTYEYKWAAGLLSRVEYRRDWSDQPFFHKGDSPIGKVDAQSTLTVAFIAFFGPKR